MRDPARERAHGLEALGMPQSALQPLHLLLLALAFGDVADRAHHAVGVSLGIAQGPAAHVHPAHLAGQQDAHLDVVHRRPAGQVRLHRRPVTGPIVSVIRDEPVPFCAGTPDLSDGISEQLLGTGSDVELIGLQIPVVDAFVGAGQRQGVAFLGGPQLFLGAPARRDVGRHRARAQQFPGRVAHKQRGAVYPADLAADSDACVQLESFRIAFVRLSYQSLHSWAVLRVPREHVGHLLAVVDGDLGSHTPLLAPTWGAVELVRLHDPVGVAVACGFDSQGIAFLGPAQRRL